MKSKSAEMTNNELIEYADIHIRYERDMLLASAGMCEANAPSNNINGFAIHNAMLESFSIHARNLIDFFYPSQKVIKNDTDVTIRNYVDEEDFTKLPTISPILLETRIKANKQVAHLTIDRYYSYQIPEEKGWDFKKISVEIVSLFNTMNPFFDRNKISGEFEILLESDWNIHLYKIITNPNSSLLIRPMTPDDMKNSPK